MFDWCSTCIPVWQGKYPLIKASLTLNKQSLGPSLVARPIFDYLNLFNGCTLRAILLQRFDLIVNRVQKCSVKELKRWMLLDLTGCYLVPFALPLRVIQPQGFHLTCLHKNHCHGSDQKIYLSFMNTLVPSQFCPKLLLILRKAPDFGHLQGDLFQPQWVKSVSGV